MKVDDAVEVNIGEEWHPGKVKRIARDGTAEVEMDDCSKLPANVNPRLIVDEEHLRPISLDKKTE